jgi:inner membrane protein
VQGKTHVAIGIATGVGLACSSGSDDVAELSLTIVLSGFASLLPDIDEDGSLINNFIFPSLKRTYRSFALAALGVIMAALYFVKGLPLWVLLIGIYAAGVAYVPHRTVTHSVLSVFYVGWVTYLISPPYVFAVVMGYLSHLFADTLTTAGVPYLWPYHKKFNLKKLGIHIKSGGKEDHLIGTLSLVLAAIGFVYLVGHIFYQQAASSGWF